MNYFAYSGLIIGIGAGICGFLVWLNNPSNPKNRSFVPYCLSILVWGLFHFLWQMAKEPDPARRLIQIGMMGAIWIPVFHYRCFSVLFDRRSQNKRWIHFGTVAAFALTASNLTPLFIQRVEARFNFPYWPVPGPAFHFYLPYYLVYIVLTLNIVRTARPEGPPTMKKDLGVILAAVFTAYACGLVNVLPWYNLPVLPYFNLAVPIAFLIHTIYFIKLGFFDVNPAYKRLTLVFLIYLFLLTLTLTALVPISDFLLSLELSPLLVTVVMGLLIGALISSGPFVYSQIIRKSFWIREKFSIGLTHELKSPLGNIKSLTELAKDSLRDGLPSDRIEDYIEMIDRNAERLDQFASDLLDTARVQSGHYDLSKTEFDVAKLVGKTVDDLKPLAAGKGIRFEVALKNGFRLRGDAVKLQQVFSNLISNAIKFSNGGTIRILQNGDGAGAARFIIKDEGSGIAADQLPHVFTKFYQGKNVNKGSGLGLSIAKAWVEAHGGKIWGESDGEGKGATVTFTLLAGG